MKLTPAIRFLTANAWAIEPGVFGRLVELLERRASGDRTSPRAMDDDEAGAITADEPPAPREAGMQVIGSVAVIPIVGAIARYAADVNGFCQDQGRSAESLQADFAAAAANPSVRQVVLVIDSPGGSVAGTSETADAIRALSVAGKPVTAYIDGFAASAAYWLASQADSIVLSAPTAQVGSIGVITAYVDAEAARAKDGVTVQVIRSTPLKAPGAFNEKMNDAQIASVQRTLADLHAAFATAVAAGRGLTDAQTAIVATGELWSGQQAIDLGLADGIASFAHLLATLDPVASTALRMQQIAASAERALEPEAPTNPPAAAAAEDTMKISALALAALIAAHPTHAAAIAAEATAGADEAAIRGKIAEIERAAAMKSRDDQITALTAERDGLATKLAAITGEHAALKAKHDKLASFHAGAPRDPGMAPVDADKPAITTKEFESLDPRAQAKFLAKGGTIVEG